MTLTFTLTDTEYIAVQTSLRDAQRLAVNTANDLPSQLTPDELSVLNLELLHLRTLLAEASINQTTNRRCKACDQTAERCADWGGDCCPLCKHEKVSE